MQELKLIGRERSTGSGSDSFIVSNPQHYSSTPHGKILLLCNGCHHTSPALHERSPPLSYLDAIWLHVPPVERLFFYRLPDLAPRHYSNHIGLISNLTLSLSQALRAFYPLAALAGRIRLTPGPGTPNRYDLFYQPGDAVHFTVAEYDDHVHIDHLATDDPRELAKIAPLVPPLPEGGAVLALQATVLHRGLALGVTVHHAACDGVGSTHFLHTWAWAAATCAGAGADAPKPPIIDRIFIRDRNDLYDIFTAPRPASRDDGGKVFRLPDADQLLATFTLPKEHLQSVKDTVAREAARRGVPPPRCTSIVATFGFVWQCYWRAKPAGREAESSCCDHRAYFLFPTDHRARMEPPVPDKYLGNCVGPCFASAPKKEIAAAGADGLFTACAAVAAAIDEAVRGGPGYWDGLMERFMEFYSSAELPLTVAGSPRFRVYEVEFGFGRPAKVDIVSVARTGAVSVAEGRGGSGGIEVGISLPADGMERFRRHFAEAIAWLSPSS